MTSAKTHQSRTEVRDGMRIDWDVDIRMDDGLVLKADVFRPVRQGRYPVILTYGPYAKGLAFQDGYTSAWQRMAEKHPDVDLRVSATTHYVDFARDDVDIAIRHGDGN